MDTKEDRHVDAAEPLADGSASRWTSQTCLKAIEFGQVGNNVGFSIGALPGIAVGAAAGGFVGALGTLVAVTVRPAVTYCTKRNATLSPEPEETKQEGSSTLDTTIMQTRQGGREGALVGGDYGGGIGGAIASAPGTIIGMLVGGVVGMTADVRGYFWPPKTLEGAAEAEK